MNKLETIKVDELEKLCKKYIDLIGFMEYTKLNVKAVWRKDG